jgi:hypothetical protein
MITRPKWPWGQVLHGASKGDIIKAQNLSPFLLGYSGVLEPAPEKLVRNTNNI